MIDWNPQRKDVLYFHLSGGEGKRRNSYLKVDCINQDVVVVHLNEPPDKGRGRNGIAGIYRLRWSTWVTGYTHWLKYDYVKRVGIFKTLPAQGRTEMKYTTENQYLVAIAKYIKTII